jgi:hypothetical protein
VDYWWILLIVRNTATYEQHYCNSSLLALLAACLALLENLSGRRTDPENLSGAPNVLAGKYIYA